MREAYSDNTRSWYDKDPILSRSMMTLEDSDDKTQIKVALNLIKIIVEHNLAYTDFTDVDEIIESVDEGLEGKNYNRWYDIDKTLRTAINMLENCPEETQSVIAKEMAKIVIDKIKEDRDLDEVNEEIENL